MVTVSSAVVDRENPGKSQGAAFSRVGADAIKLRSHELRVVGYVELGADLFDAGQGAGVIDQVRFEDIARSCPSDEVFAGRERETSPDLAPDVGAMFRESDVEPAFFIVIDRDDVVGTTDRFMAQAGPLEPVGRGKSVRSAFGFIFMDIRDHLVTALGVWIVVVFDDAGKQCIIEYRVMLPTAAGSIDRPD